MFGSDPLEALSLPDGTTVEEHDLVTDGDVLVGGQSSVEFGVRGRNVMAGERVRFGGDIEAEGDCRLDVWCDVAGNVLAEAAGATVERRLVFTLRGLWRGRYGYRDLDGNFFNAAGEEVERTDVTNLGQPAPDPDASFSSIFEDYETQVTFMPRIGVSFPVTDQALFFASYNVLSQRPSELAFTPPQTYVGLGTSRIPNPNLKPEITTQYELCFRQRLGGNAALQLSGFYRTQNNKIQIRTLQAYPTDYDSYYNVDFTTTKGATLEFDLRRTNNVSINANYTLQYAQGTGSDSGTLGQIAWRGSDEGVLGEVERTGGELVAVERFGVVEVRGGTEASASGRDTDGAETGEDLPPR